MQANYILFAWKNTNLFPCYCLRHGLHGHPLAVREAGSVKCILKIKVINKDESGECVRKPLVSGLKVCISWVLLSALPLAASAHMDKVLLLFGFSCIICEMMKLEKMISE